jgi:hypothetical protein
MRLNLGMRAGFVDAFYVLDGARETDPLCVGPRYPVRRRTCTLFAINTALVLNVNRNARNGRDGEQQSVLQQQANKYGGQGAPFERSACFDVRTLE